MQERAGNRAEQTILSYLFANGGEMGARIQSLDWSATSIGAVDTWPQSLQIALQILLSSKFPMQILWGPEYIQFYNDAYIPIAGNKHPEALGQRGADCWREVWDFSGPLLDQVRSTGTATWSEDQLMILNRHGYPEECYFTFSYSPIWDETGSVGGIFIAVNETSQKIFSERRERELRLEMEAARDAAEKANRLKDQFLAVLSHELRSPLNPILGWAKLLLSREFDAAATRRALETIERNAKLQAQMIDDLLDVSRLLREKLILRTTPIHLIALIEDAIETVRPTAEAKAIQIQTQFDQAPVQLVGDAVRLKQVVWNLLSNAIKFTPQGGLITVQLGCCDGLAQIQVTDTGRGVAADFLPLMFDHFQQADSTTTRLFGGLGLGLAIAKQIVDLHGGTIVATSPGEGRGATFTVSLPLADECLPPVEPNEADLGEAELDDVHVLVVEDDADNREMIAFTLQLYGARVTTASSAAAAIESLSNCKPDVLISDIGMAGMDGYTLMQQVRQATQTSHIPAIALTAYVSEADQQQALAAGFHDHLPKPMEPTQLVEAILKVVQPNQPQVER